MSRPQHDVVVAFPGQGVDIGSVIRVLEEHRDDELVVALTKRHALDGRTSVDLTNPVLAQPALFVASTLRARRFHGHVAFVVGHSFGEVAALVFARAVEARAGLALAAARGRACMKAIQDQPGEMLAVLGLSEDAVKGLRQRAAQSCGEVLDVAAVNAERQVVLSGAPSAVAAAAGLVKAAGGYAVRLPVPGAYHSRLMAPACADFAAALDRTSITPPCIPWRSTVDGRYHSDPSAIRTALSDALVKPVRWYPTLASHGADRLRIIDIGPDDVLARIKYEGLVHALSLDDWGSR